MASYLSAHYSEPTMSSTASPRVVEGEADFNYPAAGKPLKTWYKVTGDLTPTSIPLFILHGGPGVGSEAYNILSDWHMQLLFIPVWDSLLTAQFSTPDPMSLLMDNYTLHCPASGITITFAF